MITKHIKYIIVLSVLLILTITLPKKVHAVSSWSYRVTRYEDVEDGNFNDIIYRPGYNDFRLSGTTFEEDFSGYTSGSQFPNSAWRTLYGRNSNNRILISQHRDGPYGRRQLRLAKDVGNDNYNPEVRAPFSPTRKGSVEIVMRPISGLTRAALSHNRISLPGGRGTTEQFMVRFNHNTNTIEIGSNYGRTSDNTLLELSRNISSSTYYTVRFVWDLDNQSGIDVYINGSRVARNFYSHMIDRNFYFDEVLLSAGSGAAGSIGHTGNAQYDYIKIHETGELSGRYTSAPLRVPNGIVVNQDTQSINWVQATSSYTNARVQTRVSSNGGSSWSSWRTVTSGSPVPNIPNDTILNNYRIQYRVDLDRQNKNRNPRVGDINFDFKNADTKAPHHVSEAITGHDYKNGNDYWVRPNRNVNIRLRGGDDSTGLKRTNIHLQGSNNDKDVRSRFFYGDNRLENFREDSSLTVLSASRTHQNNTNKTREATFVVRGSTSGDIYNIRTYLEDLTGKTSGWINTGMRLGIDGTAPTASLSASTTSWTNQNVSLNLNNIKDSGSGYRRTTLPNGTTTTSSNISYSVFQNGTYSFKVEDNVGNTRTYTQTVSNIDKTKPTISFSPNGNGTYRNSHSTNVTVSDSESGVNTRLYRWTTSTSQPSSGWTSFSNGAGLTTPLSSGNHYLWIRAIDRAGNEIIQRSNVFRVDREAPTHISTTITGERYRSGSNYWVRPSDTLTITSRQRDTFSGNNQNQIRLTGNGEDVRYYHNFTSDSSSHMSAVYPPYMNTDAISFQSVRRTEHDTSSGYSTAEWKVQLNTSGHNYDLQYHLRDNAYNDSGYGSIARLRVDGVSPTLSVTPSTTSYTNNNVTLTARANDTLSGVKRIQRPNGTWVNGSTTTQIVSSNGTYTFTAEDNVGNQRTQSITVSNIDKTAPTISLSPNSRGWGTGNVSVKATASDNQSGVDAIRYRVETNGVLDSWSSWQTGDSRDINITSNGSHRIIVEARDNVGNVSSITSGHYRVDKVSPTVSLSPMSRGWDNTNVSVTASASDSHSGVDAIRYQVETNGSWGSWSSWQSGSSMTINITSTGSHRIRVEARDNVGNVSSRVTSNYYRIDKQNPTVSLSPMNRDWDNTNVSVTATGSDNHSGIDAVRYRVETNGSWGSWSSWQSGSSTTINITSNGTHRIQAQSRDVAGNTSSTITSNYYRIDKQNPTVSLSPMSRGWNNTDVNVTATGSDSLSGVDAIRYRIETNGSWGNWTSWQTGESRNINISATGSYRIQVQSRDNAGNTSSTTTSNYYRIDKQKPTVSLSPMSRGWNNTNVSVTASASDSHSGVDAIRYQIETNGSWSNWSSWQSGNSRNINLTSDGSYRIRVQSRDNVGNVSDEVLSNYYRIDKTNPTISFSPNGYDYHDEYEVNVRVADALSGVDTVRYRLTDTTSKPTSGWITGSTNFNVNIDEMGTFYLHVEATDIAGNTRYSRSNPLILFNEAPVLSKGWFTPNPAVIETDITVNLEIQDEESDDVDVELSILYPVDENGNREEHYIRDYNLTYNEQTGKYETMIYEFRPEVAGQYTMMAKLEDKYNEVVYSYTFTILDAGLTESFVEHTDGWETNRQMYNTRFQGERKRDPGTFFAGEKFLLSTQTLNTTASGDPGNIGLGGQGLFGLNNGEVHLVDKVEVKLWEKNQSGQKVKIDNMEGSDLVELDLTVQQDETGQEVLVWKGEMWHESMMEWGDKDLIFEFIAHYNNNSPNPHIEKVEVNKVVRNENEYDIRIEGNDYFRLRKGH